MKWNNIVRFPLEERVDERRDRRALSQDQQYGKDCQRDEDGRKPPALIAPEERKQLSGGTHTLTGCSEETHISLLKLAQALLMDRTGRRPLADFTPHCSGTSNSRQQFGFNFVSQEGSLGKERDGLK
jgi:hypothetical protein